MSKNFYAFPLQNPGPFIYYQTLLSKEAPGAKAVAGYASAYLTGASSLISPNNKRGQDSIAHVLNTLQQMIAYEASKEQKALMDLRKRVGKITDSPLPSPLEEPYEFIAELNTLIKGKTEALTELEQERKRIQKYKVFAGKTKKEISKMIAEETELGDLLHNMSNSIEGVSGHSKSRLTQYTGFGKTNSISSKIVQKIFQQYGAEILGVDANKGLIIQSGSTLNTVLGLITNEIERHIYQKYGKITEKIVASYLEQIERKDAEITKIVQDIVGNHEGLVDFANSIGDNIINQDKYDKALKNHKSSDRVRKLTKQFTELLKSMNLGRDDKEIIRMARQYAKEAVAATNAVTTKAYVTAETFGALDFQKLWMQAVQSGGYAKDDIGAISVTIEEEYQEEDALKQLKQKIINLQQSGLKQKTYKKGTADEYQKNNEIIEETFRQIEEEYINVAQDLDMDVEQLKQIVSLINYHGNVKSYDTISNKTAAFSGGSIGSNIKEQLANFTNLLTLSGYGTSAYDSNWLLSAIINSGSGLLGESLKGSLEQYFSTLMGLLLFDDAYYTIQQGIKNTNGQLESSTADGIHLYLLNSQYVPASFILNETYKSLTNTMASFPSHGVTVSIKARPAQGTTFTNPYDWVSERDAAIEEANLSINFMANFLGFLDNLSSCFNS